MLWGLNWTPLVSWYGRRADIFMMYWKSKPLIGKKKPKTNQQLSEDLGLQKVRRQQRCVSQYIQENRPISTTISELVHCTETWPSLMLHRQDGTIFLIPQTVHFKALDEKMIQNKLYPLLSPMLGNKAKRSSCFRIASECHHSRMA